MQDPEDDRPHRDAPRVDLDADVPMPDNLEALMRTLPDVPEPTEDERAASLAELRRRQRIRAASNSETLESPIADLPRGVR